MSEKEESKKRCGSKQEKLGETRFLIVVSMLNEYPELKARVKEWLRKNH